MPLSKLKKMIKSDQIMAWKSKADSNQGFKRIMTLESFCEKEKSHILASAVWRVEDFIIENGEVKGQSQANGVRWREFGQGYVASSFVRDQTVLCCLLPVVACGELCQVPVVISLPEQREWQISHMMKQTSVHSLLKHFKMEQKHCVTGITEYSKFIKFWLNHAQSKLWWSSTM